MAKTTNILFPFLPAGYFVKDGNAQREIFHSRLTISLR